MHASGRLIQFPREHPGEQLKRLAVFFLIFFCVFGATRAAAQQPAAAAEPPSAELLEFLGELEPVDEATWQLLEQHALRDTAQENEVNSE